MYKSFLAKRGPNKTLLSYLVSCLWSEDTFLHVGFLNKVFLFLFILEAALVAWN